MSRHYLLDGYNIIKQTPRFNRGTLEDQRKALIHWIKIEKPQGSVQNSVTVVFDGCREFFGSTTSTACSVIFSQGESADSLIKRMVEAAKPRKQWVVVSNDKDIKLYVRALGAVVLSVDEFIGKSSSGSHQKSKINKREAASKYIPLTQQSKITQELEKLWISKRPPSHEHKDHQQHA